MTTKRAPQQPWRVLHTHPRLALSVLTGALLYAALTWMGLGQGLARALTAWNLFTVLYLVLTAHMTYGADASHIERRALHEGEGRRVLLALVVIAAVVVLAAVGSQLAIVRQMQGLRRELHLGLGICTVVTAWLFTQTMFALQYAHDFYLARVHGEPDPLDFPGTTDPLYRDFLYFACIIGTSGQTADVALRGSRLRGVGTAHCVLAFAFNTVALALTINIAASLF